MTTKRRRRFTADFKKRVALEALRRDRTVQAIAAKHEVHPNQVGTWKRSRGSSPSRTPGSSTVNLRSRSRNARSRRAASFRRFVRAAPDLAASARSSSAVIAVFSASHSTSNGRITTGSTSSMILSRSV